MLLLAVGLLPAGLLVLSCSSCAGEMFVDVVEVKVSRACVNSLFDVAMGGMVRADLKRVISLLL